MNRGSLKRIVEETDSRSGRLFDFTIQILIIVSVIGFSIETLPDLSDGVRAQLRALEVVIVGVFTLEYLLRLAVSDRPLRYVFSFWGILDLVAILPFYISAGIDLRTVRSLRLLRSFRLLKIVRYNKAIGRLLKAFKEAREELVIYLTASGMTLYLAAVGIYYFERTAQPEVFRSVFDGLWWALATLTTVGYGDVYPVTAGGKVFTAVVLLIGLGIVAVPAGIIASALSQVRRNESERR